MCWVRRLATWPLRNVLNSTRSRTLEPTVAVQQYLDSAREALGALPESEAGAGLLGCADYLARQTDALQNDRAYRAAP